MEKSETALAELIGDDVTLFCVNYFYHGKLAAINDVFVTLQDAAIIYDTGSWPDGEDVNNEYADAQRIGGDINVCIAAVEAFGSGLGRIKD